MGQRVGCCSYLLLAGLLVSFLDPGPDGEGREPLGFLGRTVPLLRVERRGSVAISGLAGSKESSAEATFRLEPNQQSPSRNRSKQAKETREQ